MSGQDKNDGWETVTDEKTAAAVRKKGGSGAVELSGDDYLATLDPARAALVKAIAEGRRASPSGMALRTPYGQQLIQDVYQYDKTADDANLPGRVSARKAFTSGTQGKNYLAIATALDHTANLDDAITRLGNGRSPIPGTTRLVNGVKTAFMDADGNPRITAFDDTVTPLVDELERAYVGAGGNVADVKRLHDGISRNQSMDQQRTAVQTFARLLSGKLDELNKSYNLAMGTTGQTAPGMTDNARRLLAGYTNSDYVSKGLAGTLGAGDGPPAAGGSADGAIPPGGGPNGAPAGGISPYFKALNRSGGAITNAQGQEIISPDATSDVDSAAKARNGQLLAMVHAGEPDDEVLAAATAAGVDPAASGLNSILAYRKKTGLTNYADTTDYNIRRPTNLGERVVNTIVSDPKVTFAAEGGNAVLGGVPQTLMRLTSPTIGRKLDAVHNTNPTATVLGQLAGTAVGAGGSELLAAQGLLKLGVAGETAANLAPRVGDAAFGAISGATGDPEHPVAGAIKGVLASAAGGEVGRGIAAGSAGAIAPTGGNAAPLYEAGVRPSLGQRVVNGGTDGSLKRTVGTIINGTEEAAQSIPGLGFFVKGTRQRARNQFQTGGFNNALGDIGVELPKDAQRGSAAFRFMDQAHSDAYDDVLPRMTARADPQALADSQAIVARVRNGGLTEDSANRFDKIIADRVTRRMSGPDLSGQNLKDALSDLGTQIRTLRKPGGDSELADALDDYSQVIRDSAARNSAPEDASRLADIDRSYAKGVALANAAARAGGETAEFSPTQLLRSSQQVSGGTRSRSFLRGEGLLQDYAESGRSLVDRLPNSGTADRMLTAQGFTGAGGYLAGAVNPTTAATAGLLSLPYAPIVRNASTALLAPRSSARLNTLGALIRSNAQIPGALGAGELLQLPSQYGN